MNYLKQVQRGIDFIEANLDSDLSLAEVASHAGISCWHYQRIFKALTNETLKGYIRSRRLANALTKLHSANGRIIDIALTAGYESQESFTRSFKKVYDITPNEYRRFGKRNQFPEKIKIDSAYLHHINANVSLEPEIYQQKKLQLVGVTTEFYGVESEKNNLGEKLPPLWASFLPRLNEIPHRINGTAYGVVRQGESIDPQGRVSQNQVPLNSGFSDANREDFVDGVDGECLEYLAAVEVSARSNVPDGMHYFELPAADYAIFEHRGDPVNINNTVNYIYSSWLLMSEKRHSYGADLEIYGDRYAMDSNDSVMHYAIPVIRQK